MSKTVEEDIAQKSKVGGISSEYDYMISMLSKAGQSKHNIVELDDIE